MRNSKLTDETYLNQSFELKQKTKNNYTHYKIKYYILSNLIADNDSFYKKHFVIFDEEEKTEKRIHNNIKETIKKCIKKN